MNVSDGGVFREYLYEYSKRIGENSLDNIEVALRDYERVSYLPGNDNMSRDDDTLMGDKDYPVPIDISVYEGDKGLLNSEELDFYEMEKIRDEYLCKIYDYEGGCDFIEAKVSFDEELKKWILYQEMYKIDNEILGIMYFNKEFNL